MIVSSMSVRAFYVARALIISAILAVGLVLLAASPATATPSVFTYDAAAHAYDARVLLSSPDTGTTSVRGSPPGPEAASWVSPASVGDRGVAPKTADHVLPIGPGPQKAWSVLNRIDAKGAPLPGYKGGSVFKNSQGRLPRLQASRIESGT